MAAQKVNVFQHLGRDEIGECSCARSGVGNEITVIAPARSRDGYSVCELHGIVPIYRFSEDGSEDSHGSQNRHATRP